MKTEFPPVSLAAPIDGNRRVPIRKVPLPSVAAKEQRLIRLRQTLQLVANVRKQVSQLSPESRKAMFFRIKHDRPLGPKDFQATGFAIMGTPGLEESLIIPRHDDSLDRLQKRMSQYGDSDNNAHIVKAANLVEATTEIILGRPEDRFSEEFAAVYPKLIKRNFSIIEIEITSWKHRVGTRHSDLQSILNDIRSEFGISEGRFYDIDFEEGSALAVLSCSGKVLKRLVEDDRWQRSISAFDVRPKFKTVHQAYQDFKITDVTILPPSAEAETICVIDTGVSAGNPFLKNLIRRDISRSYIHGYEATVDEQEHGSGVASLAAYLAIDFTEGGINQAKAWIASARITDAQGELDVITQNGDGTYGVEGGRLLSNLLPEIVRDMVEGGVKIFVFSFYLDRIWSEASKKVIPRNLWLARTIDRLCSQYSIIFTTITGNIIVGDVEQLHRENPYPDFFRASAAKLCDPGQSALAVTVGSIAHAAKTMSAEYRPIVLAGKPSPFTRSGPGFAKSIKPDFVERGGNYVEHIETGRLSQRYLATDVVMASGKQSPSLNHSSGTSFAAPRVAHHAAIIATDLRSIGIDPSAELIKSFLALSATIDDDMLLFEDEELNRHIHGYGLPNGAIATDCYEHSVTTFFQGLVDTGKVLMFEFKVPEKLTSIKGDKCITICSAIAPPVQKLGIEEYLGTEMEFRLFRGDAPKDLVTAFMCKLAEAGPDDKLLAGLSKEIQKFMISGLPNLTERSVGTLQRATFKWSLHKPDYSQDDYIAAIALRPAPWWKMPRSSFRFACVIRLEDKTATCKEIYSQVAIDLRAKIENQVSQRQRV